MDLKYELSQDREVVAVVIGNRLTVSQQRTAVDHKPNTTRRGWELEQGQKGGADLSLQCSLHHADDDQVRITMMMWMMMIVPSLSHHDIRKICKNYRDFQK